VGQQGVAQRLQAGDCALGRLLQPAQHRAQRALLHAELEAALRRARPHEALAQKCGGAAAPVARRAGDGVERLLRLRAHARRLGLAAEQAVCEQRGGGGILAQLAARGEEGEASAEAADGKAAAAEAAGGAAGEGGCCQLGHHRGMGNEGVAAVHGRLEQEGEEERQERELVGVQTVCAHSQRDVNERGFDVVEPES